MKIVSSLLFLPLAGGLIIYRYVCKKEEHLCNSWQIFIKKHLYILIILLCTNSVSFVFTLFDNKNTSIFIEKEDYTGGNREVFLQLTKEEQKKDITLSVSPRIYTKEETYQKMEEAFSYLEEHMKGKNDSLDHITSDLDLSLDENVYPFEIECTSNQYIVVNNEGIVQNDEAELKKNGYSNIEEGIPVTIRITLHYQAFYQEKDFHLVVYKKEQSKDEKIFSTVIRKLEQIEKNASGEEYVELPMVIDGVSVKRTDDKKINAVCVWIFGLVLSGLLCLREHEEKKEKEKKRLENLQRCYPWFVNELVLLLGSGMQVKNIFSLLLGDYKQQNTLRTKDNYQKVLMDELEVACNSFRMGMSEETVYYQLGRRLKLPCYIKLMTLLEQNVKKGSKGMTAIMEQEEHAALEARKNMAKKYGEEAGTKLLGPMVLLLLIIMLIIMFPAFMSFQ